MKWPWFIIAWFMFFSPFWAVGYLAQWIFHPAIVWFQHGWDCAKDTEF